MTPLDIYLYCGSIVGAAFGLAYLAGTAPTQVRERRDGEFVVITRPPFRVRILASIYFSLAAQAIVLIGYAILRTLLTQRTP